MADYAFVYHAWMSRLRQNIESLFEQAEANPTLLSDRIGVSQPTLHRLLRGKNPRPSAETLRRVADYFGVTVNDLLEKDLTTGQTIIPATPARVDPGIRGLVPCLTPAQAADWREISGRFRTGDAKAWLPCPVNHGPSTFCLVVDGESMHNPRGRPSYEPGDIIFVDPDATVTSGDRVIARLDNQVGTTFKQYLAEDGRKMLKALNPEWMPRYLEINGNVTICGVVIGKWVPE